MRPLTSSHLSASKVGNGAVAIQWVCILAECKAFGRSCAVVHHQVEGAQAAIGRQQVSDLQMHKVLVKI